MSAKRAKFHKGEIVVCIKAVNVPVKIRTERDDDGYYFTYGKIPWVHESEVRKQTSREKGDAR